MKRLKKAQRGRFAKVFPELEGHVSFDVTQEVAAALRALRDTGFYGNGVDCASVAEELLRHALLDPEILTHWRIPGRIMMGDLSKRRRLR